jgi:SNF2 family DNA or RNA helicase
VWSERHSLFPYQQDAAEFMADHNALLAFDMGAGKTPTTIHAIESLKASGEVTHPGLILAPASLLAQWAREVSKFTDGSSAMIIQGPPKNREFLYLTAKAYDYVIMTYDTYVRDEIRLSKMVFDFIVLDEATAIKSFKAKRTKALKRAANDIVIRYALTGTPVENGKPEELFSILEWVDPKIPGPWWKFEKDHLIRNSWGWVEGYRNIDRFHRRVKGNILRKTVHDPEVSKYLPAVISPDPIKVRMDRKTHKVYARAMNELLADLDKVVENMAVIGPASDWDEEDPDHPDGKMMSKIQTTRMLLDHPVSVYSSAARFEDPADPRGSEFSATLVSEGLLDGLPSPKFDAFSAYLTEFLDRSPDNKVVVFCSFVDVAQFIHESTPKSVVFTGSMSRKQRDAAAVQFQTDPDTRVFISTDAGGYGLDLPQANLLINYDLPWQAGLMKQRNARIRRASSEWEHVVVQDFIVEGSIEERLSEMLRHKVAVSDAFVDGEGILEDGTISSSLDSLRSFLGAHAA